MRAGAGLALVVLAAAAVPMMGHAEPLVQQADLVYRGAFRVPPGKLGANQQVGFAYGGSSLAYHAANDSLFVVGHVYDQMTAELAIPEPVVSTDLGDLATATVLQQFHDALEGNLEAVDPGEVNGFRIGGQLVFAGHLYLSDYTYYDADTTQVTSHFVRPLDLSATGQLQGPSQVGTVGAGFVSGYMAAIPAAWQGPLGGPALTGNCCLSIISRTSCGPAAAVFDPAALGGASPAPAAFVVGYPLAHPTLGTWEGTGVPNPIYNMGTTVRGLVFPDGTQSVLFFGRTGLGTPCYGTGGASGGDCYDPVDSSKGTHAYPYAPYVWAYDAADLALAKNGTKQPWEVVPHAHWALDLPLGDDSGSLGGAAYDPATRRIFLAHSGGDAYGLDPLPIMHVLEVAVAEAPDGGIGDGGVTDAPSGDDAPAATPDAGGEGGAAADGGGGAGSDGGCGCAVPGAGGRGALALLLIGIVAGTGAAQRRRRRTASAASSASAPAGPLPALAAQPHAVAIS